MSVDLAAQAAGMTKHTTFLHTPTRVDLYFYPLVFVVLYISECISSCNRLAPLFVFGIGLGTGTRSDAGDPCVAWGRMGSRPCFVGTLSAVRFSKCTQIVVAQVVGQVRHRWHAASEI